MIAVARSLPLLALVPFAIGGLAGWFACASYRDRVEADRQAWRDWMAER